MIRSALAVLAFGFLTLSASAATDDDVLRITVDQAQLAKLPANTSTIIIGNPAIADITLLKGSGGNMVVTGKGYGVTNMIALDPDGGIIDEKQIHVVPKRNVLLVQRGAVRESYACDPLCMATPVLGDDMNVFGAVAGQIGAHDGLAGKGSAPK